MELKYKDETDTASWQLFNNIYDCSVTAAFTDNPASLEEYGSPTTGDRHRDSDLGTETTRTYRTVVQLAKLYDAGSHIQLTEYKDSLEIYNLVSTYLKEQAQIMSLNNMALAPTDAEKAKRGRIIEGIRVLTEFVNAIHPTAKIVLNNEPVHRLTFGITDGLGLMSNPIKQDVIRRELSDDISSHFTDNLTSTDLKEAARVLTWR